MLKETTMAEVSSIDPTDILTLAELAARLKVSRGWVYNQSKRSSRRKSAHPLPHFKAGRYLRFRWSEVCKWLESQRAKTGKAA
jgi:predicted DNA-binding transcriptional regulator AlpA